MEYIKWFLVENGFMKKESGEHVTYIKGDCYITLYNKNIDITTKDMCIYFPTNKYTLIGYLTFNGLINKDYIQ